MVTRNKRLNAFTLIEVMIIVAIISLLVIALMVSLSKQRSKAEDARVKDDLHRLRIAFEEYYNDNNCYPPTDWFDGPEDCGSSNMNPYLREIPCNPKTALPYVLEYDTTGCGWFKLYTTLVNAEDPEAVALCAYDGSGSTAGNYCISSTNAVCTINCTVSPSPSPSSTPTPSPTPSPSPSPTPSPSPSGDPNNYYYCQTINNCTSFNPSLESCTPYYINDPFCAGNCSFEVGSCVPN